MKMAGMAAGMKRYNWRYILSALAIGAVLSTTASFVISIAWLTPILLLIISLSTWLICLQEREVGVKLKSQLSFTPTTNLA